MEYQTGDLQSAYSNGSDDRTIVSTNAKYLNWDIDVNEGFIFYTSGYQIMSINKSLGYTPTVVHTDKEQINAVLFYKQEGKNSSKKLIKDDLK